MEEKPLNFNQPFLSVRRYTPTPSPQRSDEKKINPPRPNIPRLPHYRSELKSGPVSNPGAVPFLWEQTPGKPKEDNTKPQNQSFDKPPIAPKLPPGRHPKPNQPNLKKQAVNVPTDSGDNRRAVDILTNEISRIDSFPHDQNVEKFESSKEVAAEEERQEEEGSDSSDDGAYVDALDTLSRTESYFMNCSMSELDGLDSLKQNQRFSTDPQAREFMMDRFLPAAKAMASETPQYAPKKQSLVQEQPQLVKKSVNQNNNKPSLRYGPSFAKKYSHDLGNDNEEEDQESDDEYDRRENFPAVCGLIPRFCLKGSFGVLNPVPAMSVRTRVKMSSASKVQPRSSSSGSYSEIENESRSDRTEIKMIDKMVADELNANKSKLRGENGQLESHSRLTYCGASQENEEKDFGGINSFGSNGKGIKTFQELLADQGSPEESNDDPVIEKTLYVDTVQKSESPNLMSFLPNSRENKGVPRLKEDDHFVSDKRTEGQMDAIDSSSVEDFKKSPRTIDGEEKVQMNAHVCGNFSILSSIDNSEKEWGMEKPKYFQSFSLPPGPPPLPKSPSDSWLCRTLPSMPTKNSSSRTYFGASTNPQNQGFKAPKSDVKWETIVKTTNVQRRNLHYSEKSLTAIPET